MDDGDKPMEGEEPTEPSSPGDEATTHVMQVDVLGCIRGTQVPLKAGFLPVFEAVVNSVHATQDRFGDEVADKGRVTVHVHRVQQASTPTPGRPATMGITGFTIIDNGVGFTDDNLTSFETAYSTAKLQRGGKGMGRFSWLVVCDHAVIESVFERGDGDRTLRRFEFKATARGIEAFEEKAAGDNDLSTTIRLVGVQRKYLEALRKTTEFIVERLFEQCFGYLVVGRCPRITVVDEFLDGTQRVELNDKLSEHSIGDELEFTIGEHAFCARHVQLEARGDRHHEAHLCGNNRVVESFNLAHVSDLSSSPIGIDGASVVHHVFVSGDVLDQSVDATRTRLDLEEDASLFASAGIVDMKTLRAAIGAHVNEQLEDVLSAAQQENFEKIAQHIRSVKPEYRGLLRHKEAQLKRVEWTDNEQQMDERLYRVQQEWEAEVRAAQRAVEDQLNNEAADPDEVAEELSRVIQEVNEAGQTNLVRYVANRRAVLTFLTRLLARNAIEDHVHRVVFPTKRTSDEVDFDDHNLWLVDDTLAFYDFIASDVPLTSIGPAPSGGLRRPDVLAFKTGDMPYQHVALIEFKRPDRDDDNPVQQLLEYAILLREGGAKNADNVTMPGIPIHVRIDAYAVATLTQPLLDRVRRGPCNMVQAESPARWIGKSDRENLTLELLDFSLFVERARQRNHAFFVKLGLN